MNPAVLRQQMGHEQVRAAFSCMELENMENGRLYEQSLSCV
jgi:hypothetical protein